MKNTITFENGSTVEFDDEKECIRGVSCSSNINIYDMQDNNIFEKDEYGNSATIISTCLKCGSNDISIEEDISYDYNECPYVSGYYLKCNCCGNLKIRLEDFLI